MAKIVRILLLFFVLNFVFDSCVPPEKVELTEVKINLKDSIYRSILTYQDKRLTDSIVKYINHEDPTYRYASIMAFSSIQDTNASDLIVDKLHDKVAKVREAAAYALGQIGSVKYQDSLISVFGKYDTLEPNSMFNSNILEAIGKVGDDNYLKSLATIKSYRPTDTLLISGQIKGLFRFITRGKSVPEGTERVLDLIGSSIYPEEIKMLGSSYLIRAKNKDLQNYTFRLAKLFKKEKNPIIKMNLAIALGKTKNAEVLPVLKEVLLDIDTDNKVKVSIINAFGNFKYIDVVEIVIQHLEYKNNNVALSAANYLVNFGMPNDVTIYRKATKKELDWNVKATLFRAILKHVPVYFSKTKSASIWDVKKQINTSENPFEKAAYLKALGEDINSYKYIYENGFKAPETLVRVASMEAYTSLLKKETILKFPKWKLKRMTEEIKDILYEAINSGDVGIIATAVEAYENSVIDFKGEYEDLNFITKVKKSLVIPRDIEAYNAVMRLEKKWLNKSYLPLKIKYNNAIDWELFDKLGENPMAKIKTNKGEFVIELLKNESPGSVVNFVKLANDKFFEGKKFHRVVPNFVIQTGCTRGDGYGSLNYTVRSELGPLSYNNAGLVGMASAGKDTESTQWFVTLAPAPHLDGRYTIFGKVSKNIDVIDKISVGDIIEEVTILK